MKFTALLLLATCLQVSASGYSQKVTLSLKNASMEKAFKSIKKQTGFVFFFDEAWMRQAGSVTIDVKDEPVEKVLDICFTDKPITYSIIGNTVVVKLRKKSTEHIADVPALIEINGVVTDENNKSLQGVSIVLKGTDKGTTSDANGKFAIQIPEEGGVLVLSYVGYEPIEREVTKSGVLNFVMKPKEAKISEVVVIGYDRQRKKNQTSSVTTISGEILENRPLVKVTDGLQGAIAGLNIVTNNSGGAPDASKSINIRGYTGLGTAGGPLIVIDGVQGGDINNINPDDVESISVLKDAAATAIYGSSAPYGAILVTTKKGKKSQKASITYNNNLNWAEPINLPTMLNSLTFAELYNEASKNAGRADIFSESIIKRIKDYQAGIITDQTSALPSGAWGSYETSNANNDFFKIYFKDRVFSQQHNLSVSGGSDKSSYFVGLGYNHKNGIYNFAGDQFKRYNLRVNLSSAVTNWLTFNLRSSFAKGQNNTPNTYPAQTGELGYMNHVARKWPTVPLKNPDGHYSEASHAALLVDGGRNILTQDYPMITGELVLTPATGWSFTANYTYDGYMGNRQEHQKTLYHYRADGSVLPINGTFPNGFTRGSERSDHHVTNVYSAYEKKIGRQFFKILGGFTSELRSYTGFSASNTNLYSNDIPSLTLTYSTTPAVGDVISKLAIAGYFGRFNYVFDDKYIVEFTGRYDATSRFLENKRWKFSPGVSAGWNVDEEAFWENIKPIVNAFKIRGSYGSSPDQLFLGGNWYPFYPSLSNTAPSYTRWLFGNGQEPSISQPGLVNPDLTWVTMTSYGIGTDISLLNRRLNVTFDYFVRKADDFVGPAQVLPSILGATAPDINNTSIKNKGFDLSVQWQDKIGGDFGYTLRGVLSDFRGTVTKYNNPTKNLGTFYTGQKMGEIWGYQTEGYYTTETAGAGLPAIFWNGALTAGDIRYADLDHNGRIDNGKNLVDTSGDLRIIGNRTPRFQYGFTGSADYKGLDIMIFIQGVAKRDVWLSGNYFWGIAIAEYASSPFTAHLDRWTPETPNGYYPKFYMDRAQNSKNQQVQSKYLQNAAYMRIKTLQLGYSLPRTLLTKLQMQRARLFVGVENLATFTKLVKTMDPELALSDGKIYPLQRTYSCGINVTF